MQSKQGLLPIASIAAHLCRRAKLCGAWRDMEEAQEAATWPRFQLLSHSSYSHRIKQKYSVLVQQTLRVCHMHGTYISNVNRCYTHMSSVHITTIESFCRDMNCKYTCAHMHRYTLAPYIQMGKNLRKPISLILFTNTQHPQKASWLSRDIDRWRCC